MVNPSSCDPCACIPPNMSDSYFKQAILEVACQILTAIENGGGGGGCGCPDFIRKDGTTITTAQIPFALGLSTPSGIASAIAVGSGGSLIYDSTIPGDDSFVIFVQAGHRLFYDSGGGTSVEYGMPVFYSDNVATWGLTGQDGQIYYDDNSYTAPYFVIANNDPVPGGILFLSQVDNRFQGNVNPFADATYDLGTALLQWKDLYLSGTLNTPSITVDDVFSAANTLGLNAVVDIRFLINGALEATITANALTFNNGAVDTSIGWSVSDRLDLTASNVLVSAAIEIDGDLNHDGTNVGFFGVAPVARPGTTADIKDALTSLGLLQGTSPTPLNLDAGTLSAGNISSTALTAGQFLWYNAGAIASDADATFDGVNATFTRLFGRIGYQSGGAAARVPMVLIRSNTQNGNAAGGAASTLWSETIAADTLEFDGDYIKYEATGTFAANANTKQITITLGATTIFDSGALAITAAGDWHIQGCIYRTGASTQKNWATLTSSSLGTLTPPVDYSTSSESDAGALTFALKGAAAGANDIVFECGIGMYGPQAA